MLSDDQVLEIHRLASEGMPQAKIAAQVGTYQQTVQAILAGKKYKHVHWDGPPPKHTGRVHPHTISAETRAEIRKLLANGGSTGAVARKTGVSQTFVHHLSHEHE